MQQVAALSPHAHEPSHFFHLGTYMGSSLDLHIIHETATSITFPFRRVRNLILLEGMADQMEGFFILDTGAPYLVLNKTYFREKETRSDWMAAGIGGQQSSVMATKIQELKIQDLSWTDVNADVLALSHIENKLGAKILGLLGTALFREYEIEINYAEQIIILHFLDKKGNRLNELEGTPISELKCRGKLQPHENMILIQAKIARKKLLLCVDTGAEMMVLSKLSRKKILNQVEVDQRMLLHGTDGSSIEVLGGRLYELNLPGADLCDVPAIIASLEDMGKAYHIQIDGMIGHSLLEKGIFCVNFVKKEWSFHPYDEIE